MPEHNPAHLPGLPTAAELFVLPYQDGTRENKRSPEDLEQISEVLIHKLNQNLVHFELKPGVQVLVHAAHLTAAPLVDLTPTHSGSAMLMLLSVVFVGLAVFVIYKFKRGWRDRSAVKNIGLFLQRTQV